MATKKRTSKKSGTSAPKKAPAKKAAPAKKSVKKAAKKAVKKKAPTKKVAAKKAAARKSAPKTATGRKPASKSAGTSRGRPDDGEMKPIDSILDAPKPSGVKLTEFQKKQRQRLLSLRDEMLDSMSGVAKDTLRSRAEGSEASAFGMHQADAGSDAYDRDFALSLLSQEQDALYEIDEALKRLEQGTYGVCEISGKPIPKARLEAMPFARLTVECQSEFEKDNRNRRQRYPATSLFGISADDSDDDDGVDNKE